jgi:hypothetical protein
LEGLGTPAPIAPPRNLVVSGLYRYVRKAACLDRAADAERRAAEATDNQLRVDNEGMAAGWRHVARSYEYVLSLEAFMLAAERSQAPEPQGCVAKAGGALQGNERAERSAGDQQASVAVDGVGSSL